jgi:hypothetical protein
LVAQVPDTLIKTISSRVEGVQGYSRLGQSVAVDESSGLTVVGAPLDDTGGEKHGVVKVFDTATGELRHVLTNPNIDRQPNQEFGFSVAISGTRVVVGHTVPFRVSMKAAWPTCTT